MADGPTNPANLPDHPVPVAKAHVGGTIPFTDPRYQNLRRWGRVSIPIYDKLPGTYTGADVIAVRTGAPPTVVYTYYVWTGAAWVAVATGTGGNTLDQSYDQGGPGVGRTITADSGAVLVQAGGGVTNTLLDLRRAIADLAVTVLQAGITGEANPRFDVTAAGRHSWGVGGASAVDVWMERIGATVLQIAAAGSNTGTLRVDNVEGRTSSPSRFHASQGVFLDELSGLKVESKTISAGSITITNGFITVLGQGGVDDDLDTIGVTGGSVFDGDWCIIMAENDTQTITIKHGTGNIECIGNADIVLDDLGDWAMLVRKGTVWYALSGGGGSGGHTIKEDGTPFTARAGLNFLEPDATLLNDDAVGDETEVNMALYALLAGRSGGQTIAGGTATTQSLTLKGNSVDSTGLVNIGSRIKFLSTGGSEAIADPNGVDLLKFTAASPAKLQFPEQGEFAKHASFLDAASYPAAGGSGKAWLYNKNGFLTEAVDMALTVEFIPGAPTGMIFAPGQLGGWAANGGTWSDGFFGLAAQPTAGGTAPTFGLDSNGHALVCATAASTGAISGFEGVGNIVEEDCKPWMSTRFKLEQTTLCRFFIGFSDQSLATMLASDNPAGSYVGIQYSSARGDTTFQWVNKDGTTQSLLNTTIAVDTAVHYVAIICPLGNNSWVKRLATALGVTEKTSLHNTNTPAATTGMKFMAGIETRTTAAKTMKVWQGVLAIDR